MEKFIFCALLILLFYGWLWMDGSEVYLHFKHQPRKMVKYIQTIRRQKNLFDHFVWLGLKGLNALRITYEKTFCDNIWRFQVIDYSCKNSYYRCFIVFQIQSVDDCIFKQ